MIFSPDFLLPDIFALTPAFLAEHKIRGVIFDIDNTLVGYQQPEPTPEVVALLRRLQDSGAKIALVSNNSRVRVERFAKGLSLPAYHRSAKPFGFFLHKVRRAFDLPAGQIALVGDQVFTDALGGNCAGMKTVLVEPIDKKETPFFRFKRALERPFIERRRRKDGKR